MMAPEWMNAVIRDFGRSAGVESLALDNGGAATLSFDSGVKLQLEYCNAELVVAVTFNSDAIGHASLKRLLSFSRPQAKVGVYRIRTGLLARSGRLVAAIRLPERDVTLPHLNEAFSILWRVAEEIGGVE